VLVILFSAVQPTFHSLYNVGNMLTEGAGPILIAMGLVFVLLLGEIDLSAGYAAGVCAFVMVRLMVGYNYNWFITMGAAVLTGVVHRFPHRLVAGEDTHSVVCRDAGFLPGFPGCRRC